MMDRARLMCLQTSKLLAILKEVHTVVFIGLISWLLPAYWLKVGTITNPTLVSRSIVKKFLVALQSKAWVCDLLSAGIAGSIHAQGMNICLLRLLRVVYVRVSATT
jgi:hypothetical protein